MRLRPALLALLVVAPAALALPPEDPSAPLDDDAGSGRDAGETPAGAILLAPGRYRGTLMRGVDPLDHYAFDAPANGGVRIVLRADGNVPFLNVTAPDGTTVPSRARSEGLLTTTTQEHLLLARAEGRYGVRLSWGFWDAYELELDVVARPADDDLGSGRDAGTEAAQRLALPDGASEGRLDPWDREDGYWFDAKDGDEGVVVASGATRVTITDRANARSWSGFEAASWSARGDVRLEVTLFDAPEAPTPYVVELARASRGAYPTRVAEATASAMMPAPEGGVLLALPTGVARLALDGAMTPVTPQLRRAEGLALDAAGALYGTTFQAQRAYEEAIVRAGAGSETFVYPASGALAFGADGALYFGRWDGLARTHDGVTHDIARPGAAVRDLAFCADGSLLAIERHGPGPRLTYELARYAPSFAEREVVGTWEGDLLQYAFVGLACGVDGSVLTARDRGVWRYTEAGATRLAHLPPASFPRALAVADGHVLVAGSFPVDDGAGYRDLVLRVPAPVDAFTGYRPPFTLGPTVDLVVEDVEVAPAPLGGSGHVRATLRNVGALPLEGRFDVAWWREGSTSTGIVGVVASIPPGGTYRFETPPTSISSGTWRVHADWGDDWFERNEDDNVAAGTG